MCEKKQLEIALWLKFLGFFVKNASSGKRIEANGRMMQHQIAYHRRARETAGHRRMAALCF
jgi:hypothetical protein